jgi:hypothetical protein
VRARGSAARATARSPGLRDWDDHERTTIAVAPVPAGGRGVALPQWHRAVAVTPHGRPRVDQLSPISPSMPFDVITPPSSVLTPGCSTTDCVNTWKSISAGLFGICSE